MEQEHTKENIKSYLSKCLPIVFFSALTGVLSGIVVILYNYVAELLSHSSHQIYHKVLENPAFVPLLFVGLTILAFISYVIIKYIPEVRGPGVPRTEALVRGLKPISWWRMLVGTILGSFVSFFGGLSLGSEGPSTALGSAVGDGVSKLYKSKKTSEEDKKELKLLVAVSGSSAAVTSAFKAPITGLIFTLEELEQKFSPFILLAAGSSITTSIFTSTALRALLNMEQSILEVSLSAIPFSHSWALLILGVACGIVAVVFTKLLEVVGELKILKKVPLLVKLVTVYAITGLVGLFLSGATGGGIMLIKDLLKLDFSWWIILITLLVKMLLTALALGSESSGGLLIPTLTTGALVGALFGKAFIAMGLPSEYYTTFIVLGMSAFLGASFRTPVTAVVLLVEITGSLSGILTIGVEVLIAFIVAELLMRKPIYDTLMERALEEDILPPKFKFPLLKKKNS